MQRPLELEVLEPGNPRVQRRRFLQPALLVGRDEQCDLCLNDLTISRCHAYLQVIGGRVFFLDLGSVTTGIRTESGWVLSGWLDPGQQLRLGGYTVRLAPSARSPIRLPSASERSWTPLDRQMAQSATDRGWLLEFDRDHPPWRLNRVLTLVGRAANCQLRIHAESVSRYHAALLQTPQGVWVIDLLSHEGTCLNGRPIRFARLEDGSQLGIGRDCAIRVWQPPGAARAPSRVPAARVARLPSGPPKPLAVVPIRRLRVLRPALAADAERLLAAISLKGNHPENAQSVSVIQQLNLMQQQMVDQCHQVLLTMAQMFCSMHREQMMLVRQELARVHQLTDELQGIQQELKKELNRDSEVSAATIGRGAPASPPNGTAPRAACQIPSVAAPNDRTLESAQRDGNAAHPPKASAHVSAPPDTDIHAWLTQRMVALQEERQGRLRKVLGMILGKG